MQRYFVPPSAWSADQIEMVGDDAHHLIKVLRATPGYRFVASDGVSRDVLAEVQHMDKGIVIAAIVEELPRNHEPQTEIWIAQSLPKADKMDMVIQKCTELGAYGFIPFSSARTIVQYDSKKEQRRMERWRKIAKEAAEQAGRNRLPEIKKPCTADELIAQADSFHLVLFCYEQERKFGIKARLRDWKKQSLIPLDSARLLLIVGPEGGFTEQEAVRFAASGFLSTGLGRRVLRTETAAMVALACVLYELDEMEG